MSLKSIRIFSIFVNKYLFSQVSFFGIMAAQQQVLFYIQEK